MSELHELKELSVVKPIDNGIRRISTKTKHRYPNINDSGSDDDQVLDKESSSSIDDKLWTLALAKRLRSYSYESAALEWQHNEDAQYYNSLNVQLTLYATLISTISAVAIAGIAGLLDQNNLTVFYTLSGVTITLNLAVSMINAWKYVNNYVFKIIEHSEKSAKFGRLHRKIKNQFALPLAERHSAPTLLAYTADRFSELDSEKPFIRSSTASAWEVHAKKRGKVYNDLLSLPAEFMTERILRNDPSISWNEHRKAAARAEQLRPQIQSSEEQRLVSA